MTILQKFNPLSGNFDLVADVPSEIGAVTSEPTGFPNVTDTTISFNPTGTLFTITSVGTNFAVWQKGVKYLKTTTSLAIPTPLVTGQYFFYYDTTGTLVVNAVNTPWNLLTDAPVALVYWNATTLQGRLFEERHGIIMDSVTHRYNHLTRGTQAVSGMQVSGFTLNLDTLAAVSIAISNGTIADEDLFTTISGFDVDPASFPVYSRSAANGDWSWTTPQQLYFRTAVAGSNRVAFNEFTGGVWTQTEASNGNYVNCWILATPDTQSTYRIISVQGQAQYTSLALAQAATFSANVSLGTFPFAEFIPLYRITLQTNTGYLVAAGKARVQGVSDIRTSSNTGSSVSGSGGHSGLSGRSDPNSHPATAISTTPPSFGLDPAIENTVELAIDRLSEYGFVGVWTTAKAYRIGQIVGRTGPQSLWYCQTAHTSGTFETDKTNWLPVSIHTVSTSNIATYTAIDLQVIYIPEQSNFYQFSAGSSDAVSDPFVLSGFNGRWKMVSKPAESVTHTQNSHGFIIGDWLYNNAGVFTKADNALESTAEVCGIVVAVTSNTFTMVGQGTIPLSGTAGGIYFLGTNGARTLTEPTVVGTIKKPLGIQLTSGLFQVKIDRGDVVGGTNVQQSASLLNNTASQAVVNLTGISGGYINAIVYIDATTKVRQEFLLLFSKNAVGTTWSCSTLSTTGENSLTTFDIDTSGILRASVGNHAGFVSGLCTYSINAPAMGATFPVTVSAANVLGRTDGVAPAAGYIGQVAMNQANGGVTATYGAGAATVSSSTLTTGTYLVFCDVTGYNNIRPSAGSGTQTLEIQVNSVKIAEALYLAPWYSTPDSSNDVSHFCMVLIGTVTVPSGATHTVNTLMTAISNSGTPTGYSCTTRTSGKLMAIRIA
jgi:hypothetical protein